MLFHDIIWRKYPFSNLEELIVKKYIYDKQPIMVFKVIKNLSLEP